MKNNDLLKLTESSILVALAIVIDWAMKEVFLPLSMPAGGHVSIATLFLIFIGFRNGKNYGFIGCIVFAIVNWLLDGRVTNIWSIFLDYIIAFGIFGISGFFKNVIKENKQLLFIAIFFVCTTIRFISSTISGIIAFDTPLWGSIVYNAPYTYVSFILSVILGCILLPKLKYI